MKIDIITTVDVDNEYQAEEIGKIFKLLVDKGALTGVRGGSTNIHFDDKGIFKGIQFSYFVWRERY